MQVQFTAWAEECLLEIFNYYAEKVNHEKAIEIVSRIIDRAESLEQYAKRGKQEEDLHILNKGHRYLLEYHYKIIYRIEEETIYITDIFSTRQNPDKKLQRNS